jgi:hypothetical protein
MPPLRWVPLLVVVLSTLSIFSAQESGARPKPVSVHDSCPVTKPGDQPFVPPSGYPSKINEDYFWYGTDRLWVLLPGSGMRTGLPHYTPKDPTFRQKIMWWRQGLEYPAASPTRFRISGKRLDAPAPPLLSDRTANLSREIDPANGKLVNPAFIMSGVNFPTVGCWEVTGRYGQDDLTFVIWIAE